MIDGDPGRKFESLFKFLSLPVGDKKAFARAILRLLADKSLRESMAQKARKVAARFSWEEVAKAELKLFYALAQQD